MSNILREDFEHLSELIRSAYALISPITHHDDLKKLTPEFMMTDSKKRPGCYLKLGQGADHTLFPICNLHGGKDPKMIKFSIKFAKKMAERPNADVDSLQPMIVKLERMLKKYSSNTPKTMSQAVLKGKSTRKFNLNMK